MSPPPPTNTTGWVTPPMATLATTGAEVTPWRMLFWEPPHPLLRPRYVCHTTCPVVYVVEPTVHDEAHRANSPPFHEPTKTSVDPPTVATTGWEKIMLEQVSLVLGQIAPLVNATDQPVFGCKEAAFDGLIKVSLVNPLPDASCMYSGQSVPPGGGVGVVVGVGVAVTVGVGVGDVLVVKVAIAPVHATEELSVAA